MIYFDSAATSKEPKFVSQSIYNFSQNYRANIHRGVCKLSQQATEYFEKSRLYVANFINARSPREIIFTSGTTRSLNLLAMSLCKSFDVPQRDFFVTTEMEHTSNIVVWQAYCNETHKKRLWWIPLLPNGLLDYNEFESFVKNNGNRIFLVTFTHISNALGTVNDIKRIIDLCHQHGILTCVDAAQSIAHTKIDVQALDCDFLAFSGHKVYAPTGVGVLYAKESFLQQMKPVEYGGGGVVDVGLKDTKLAEYPFSFEVGTPNIAGVIGLKAALYWLTEIQGKQKAFDKEEMLYKYAVAKIEQLPNFKIIGSPEHSKGIIAIVHNRLSPDEVAKILSDNDICVRSGRLCAHTLIKILNLPGGVCRISLSFENTQKEIDYLCEVLKKIN